MSNLVEGGHLQKKVWETLAYIKHNANMLKAAKIKKQLLKLIPQNTNFLYINNTYSLNIIKILF